MTRGFGAAAGARLVEHAKVAGFEDPQDGGKVVAAPQDLTVRADDGIEALPEPETGAFLDPVEGGFGCPAEHGKDRGIARGEDAVVAPFAQSDHPAIDLQDQVQFGPVEGRDPGVGKRDRIGRKECHDPDIRAGSRTNQALCCPGRPDWPWFEIPG